MTAFSETLTEGGFLADSVEVTHTVPQSETGLGLTDVASATANLFEEALTETISISETLSVQLGWTQAESGFTIVDDEVSRDVTDTIDETTLYDEELTVKFPVYWTDDDVLDTTDDLVVSLSIVRTITESMGLTEVLQHNGDETPVDPPVIGESGVYLFLPPTVDEAPAGGHRLFVRYKLSRGISVLITDGVAREVRWPSTEECLAADDVYLGGHRYYVNAARAAILSAAGYGDRLTVADAYLETYEGGY